MIEIDGAHGESGGQIIRTSMTLASITQKPIKITNIRAGRPKPGLAAQHLTAVKAVRKVCRGTLEGAELGSNSITFTPGNIVGGHYDLDIGTAGSVTLVAQTLLPILLAAEKESEIIIIGGTHVMKSPGYDYFENVFLPAIRKMGARIESEMLQVGYYPKGGGKIRLKVKPSKLVGVSEWKIHENIQAIIRIANLPLSVAMREKKILIQNNITDVRIPNEKALSVGNAVTLWNGYKGAYVIGEKGKRAEVVAQEAVDELKKETGDVDKHLADQLLIYAALAEGKTHFKCSEETNHYKTNKYVISRFI